MISEPREVPQRFQNTSKFSSEGLHGFGGLTEAPLNSCQK